MLQFFLLPNFLGDVVANKEQLLGTPFPGFDHSVRPRNPEALSRFRDVLSDLVDADLLVLERIELSLDLAVALWWQNQLQMTADKLVVSEAEQFAGMAVSESDDAIPTQFKNGGAHKVDQLLVACGQPYHHILEDRGQASQFVPAGPDFLQCSHFILFRLDRFGGQDKLIERRCHHPAEYEIG